MPSNSGTSPTMQDSASAIEARIEQSRASWVPPGAPVEIQGRVIPGGMIYTGTRLIGLHPGQSVEPAFIDSRLKATASTRAPSYSRTPAFQAYAEMTPARRGKYLDWLAAGRPAEGVIENGALFLMGLERRILFDARHDDSAQDELPMLFEELEQLFMALAIQRDWNIAARFANLPLVTLALLPDFDPTLLEAPVDILFGWSPPFSLQLGLGAFASQDRPLSAAWAYAWVMNSNESRVPSVRIRCPEEHDPLFERAYRAEFGKGVRIHATRNAPMLTYDPVNPTFGGPLPVGRTPIPLIGPPGPKDARLRRLVAAVSEVLEDFVAHIPWNADGPMLSTYAYYPTIAGPLDQHPVVAQVAAMLAESVGTDSAILIQRAAFMELFPEFSNPITPNQASALTLLMNRIGYGIEPDPELMKTAFSRTPSIAIYRMDDAPDPFEAERRDLAPLLRVFGFWSYVSAAEGTVDLDAALAVADELSAFLELEPFEVNSLYAHLLWLSAYPATLNEARQRFTKSAGFSPEEIGRMVAGLVSLMRPPTKAEIKALERVYKTLGLDNEQLHRELHIISVSIAEANQRNADSAASNTAPVYLDPTRIQRIEQQTAAVTDMLRELFEEAPLESGGNSAAANAALPIDPIAELAARLTSKSAWRMDELSALTQSLGLMTTGAIETLNDRAVALGLEPPLDCDGAVCDCYEPTLKELLAHG